MKGRIMELNKENLLKIFKLYSYDDINIKNGDQIFVVDVDGLLETIIARFGPPAVKVEAGSIKSCLYEFMGYCSVRYSKDKDLDLSMDDIKAVDKYSNAIINHLNKDGGI